MSKHSSSSSKLDKALTALPLDLQRTIANKLSPNTKAMVGMSSSIEDAVKLFDAPEPNFGVFRSGGIKNIYIQVSDLGGFLSIFDNQVTNVRLTIHSEVSVYWNSPQHNRVGFNPWMDGYSEAGFNVLNGKLNKGYLNLLYALIITLHRLNPYDLNAEIYTNILTRFRRTDLLQAYPPIPPRTDRPPRVQRMSSSTYKAPESWEKLIGQYDKNHMEGVLGHNDAVRTFLKPKTKGTMRTALQMDSEGYTMQNGKRYKVHQGVKGGVYIVVNGKKKYVK